jgi:hypothetical protein
MKPGTLPLCLFLAGLAILTACETLPDGDQIPVLLSQTGFDGRSSCGTGR